MDKGVEGVLARVTLVFLAWKAVITSNCTVDGSMLASRWCLFISLNFQKNYENISMKYQKTVLGSLEPLHGAWNEAF